MKTKCTKIFGWYGVVVILLAYVMVSFGFLEAKSNLYQILNATGAFGTMNYALSKKSFPNVIMDGCWGIVAMTALIKNSIL